MMSETQGGPSNEDGCIRWGEQRRYKQTHKQEGLKCNPSEIWGKDVEEFGALRSCVCELHLSLWDFFLLEAMYKGGKITNISFKELKDNT